MMVVQAVLLYGSETWAMTPHIGKALGGFHHRMAFRMTGQKLQRGVDGRWVYPPLEEAMEEEGLQEVETFLLHHQNTVTQFIATVLIIDIFLALDIQAVMVAGRPGRV